MKEATTSNQEKASKEREMERGKEMDMEREKKRDTGRERKRDSSQQVQLRYPNKPAPRQPICARSKTASDPSPLNRNGRTANLEYGNRTGSRPCRRM